MSNGRETLMERRQARGAPARQAGGFTLIELLIVLTIIAVLVAVGYPSYQQYTVRGARAAAQEELIELVSIQEKIYLNSNAYTTDMTKAYDGRSTGGLGRTTGKSADGKYTLAFAASAAQSYTITATPVSGTPQASDGNISITSSGARTCDSSKSWCPNGTW